MGGEPLASSRYISEFIGTYMLVFSVGCNVVASGSAWAVVSIAATLMVAIYALGSVSGGHFNPAVTFAVGLAGKMPWIEVATYMAVQVAAGTLAGASYTVLLMETLPLSPGKGVVWWQAGLAEFFYTFMLAFVVLNVAVTRRHANDQFYGLAIGFVVVAGGYAAGPLSGGCFNPAVALGIDISSMYRGNFGWSLLYTCFELAGGALATTLFKVVRPDDDPAQRPLYSRLTSEFLGTFMLVLTVGLNVLGKSPAAAFSIAASLMCMIYALGSVSGAHFNPAVTFALVLTGKHTEGDNPAIDALLYVGTQTAAGVCAAFTYALLTSGRTFQLEPQGSAGWYEAWLVELAFTFLLAFVVLSVATVQQPLTQFFGLAIGSCVTAGGFAAGGISGGSLNPAVSAGIAISSTVLGKSSIMHMVAYIISELCGGAVAAGAFYMVRPEEVAPERTPLKKDLESKGAA
mmetsp:Transcript_19013/g.34352  ORF Transcript_19013/g.34352 Transcript_19013/m.34352 type:complete len:459 (+) Transcript_19013:102-1478(+)